MKYLLVLAVLWVAIWLWRKNRREEMRDAMRLLLASDDVVAEPSAAASVAALLQATGAHSRPVVALITGRNVAPELRNP